MGNKLNLIRLLIKKNIIIFVIFGYKKNKLVFNARPFSFKQGKNVCMIGYNYLFK